MITAGDDSTMRIWELGTGRCSRTIFAHDDKKFVSCLSWGRQPIASLANGTASADKGGKGGAGKDAEIVVPRPVNVLATGSWDKVCLLLYF